MRYDIELAFKEMFEQIRFPLNEDYVFWFEPPDVAGKAKIEILADRSQKDLVDLQYQKYGTWTDKQEATFEKFMRSYAVGIVLAWEPKGLKKVRIHNYDDHGIH